VTRHNKWLCEACRSWRKKYWPPQECPSCRRQVAVNERGFCRLCCRQATLARTPHTRTDVVECNGAGQQLYLADRILKKRKPPGWPPPPPPARVPAWPAGYPVSHRQLVLFEMPRELALGCSGVLPPPALPELAASLDRAVEDYAAKFGWRRNLKLSTVRGIRVLLATQDTPGAKIKSSEAGRLLQLPNLTVRPVVEVLASVGMLDDDRQPPLEAWFTKQSAGLPRPMAGELASWFHALRDGSTATPRTRLRPTTTVYPLVVGVLPALRTWADAGYSSLREVSRQDVAEALPAGADRRRKVLGGLRSLFRFLKARRAVFVNPTARMRAEPAQVSHPLPVDLAPVREALNSTDPARAALAALVAFHAPRAGQVRALRLGDVGDGRLSLPGRTVLLARPVMERLNAWLDERERRWPGTANPHLFVNQYTAVRTCPVSKFWVTKTIGMSAEAIRQDRILDEALATGGDVRRLGDLFGLSVGGAERYARSASPPPCFEDEPSTVLDRYSSRTVD
jgi:hypothetical protein